MTPWTAQLGSFVVFSAVERKPQSSTDVVDLMRGSMQGTVPTHLLTLFVSPLER
jgi:hypothetical protein